MMHVYSTLLYGSGTMCKDVFDMTFQFVLQHVAPMSILYTSISFAYRFTFPLIFVVYNTISTSITGKFCLLFSVTRFILTDFIIGFFLVLPYIVGIDSLLCAHPSLIVANAKPTDFCKVQGTMYIHN